MFTDSCTNSQFLSTILLIKNIITLIQIAAPIILVIMASLDIMKYIINPDDKIKKKIMNRFLMASIIFFVPVLVSFTFDLVDNTKIFESSCWTNANQATVDALRLQEEEEAKIKLQILESQLKASDQEKLLEEMNKVNASANAITSLNGTDGQVTVKNGVFYYPKNGTSGLPGTSGTGQNGLNNNFWSLLSKFFDSASSFGHSISCQYGWRSYDSQVQLYQKHLSGNGNTAAKPGSSMHGWGIACDLYFKDTESKNWAHANASKFGLNFSVCANYFGGNCNEDWHIVPSSLVGE